MSFKWIVSFFAIALAIVASAQGKDLKWPTKEVVLDMMFSNQVAPPENLPQTPAQLRSAKALWRRMSASQRRVILKGMCYSYLRGPYNRPRLTDAELIHLLGRGLSKAERNTLGSYMKQLSSKDKDLVKRMLLNCLTRTM